MLCVPLSCAHGRLAEAGRFIREDGPLNISLSLYPPILPYGGEVHLTVRIEGVLPKGYGQVIAWEQGCKSTFQSWEPPPRAAGYRHSFHSAGEKRVWYGLVDLETQKIVGSAWVGLRVGVEGLGE